MLALGFEILKLVGGVGDVVVVVDGVVTVVVVVVDGVVTVNVVVVDGGVVVDVVELGVVEAGDTGGGVDLREGFVELRDAVDAIGDFGVVSVDVLKRETRDRLETTTLEMTSATW
jgi:hypothetical protein